MEETNAYLIHVVPMSIRFIGNPIANPIYHLINIITHQTLYECITDLYDFRSKNSQYFLIFYSV